ncbi:hypothetical protein LEMLEM_LOCUS22987 [Lemmus lemmus]
MCVERQARQSCGLAVSSAKVHWSEVAQIMNVGGDLIRYQELLGKKAVRICRWELRASKICNSEVDPNTENRVLFSSALWPLEVSRAWQKGLQVALQNTTGLPGADRTASLSLSGLQQAQVRRSTLGGGGLGTPQGGEGGLLTGLRPSRAVAAGARAAARCQAKPGALSAGKGGEHRGREGRARSAHGLRQGGGGAGWAGRGRPGGGEGAAVGRQPGSAASTKDGEAPGPRRGGGSALTWDAAEAPQPVVIC